MPAIVLVIGILVFGVFALLPAYLIVIARRRVARAGTLGEGVPAFHLYSLRLQTFCFASLVYLALFSQTDRFSSVMTRNTVGLPIFLSLGVASVANLTMALRRGALRDLLVANGLIIGLDLWMMMAVVAAGWMAQF